MLRGVRWLPGQLNRCLWSHLLLRPSKIIFERKYSPLGSTHAAFACGLFCHPVVTKSLGEGRGSLFQTTCRLWPLLLTCCFQISWRGETVPSEYHLLPAAYYAALVYQNSPEGRFPPWQTRCCLWPLMSLRCFQISWRGEVVPSTSHRLSAASSAVLFLYNVLERGDGPFDR